MGGTLGLNPLELKSTPEHFLAARGADASPLMEWWNWAVSFFANYFAHHNLTLGDRRTTLELPIDQAYEDKGIIKDISTHSRESPTVRDVHDILEEMDEDADEFMACMEAEGEKL